jgi:hypothetical protein
MPRIGDPRVFAIDVEDDSTPNSPLGTLWGRAQVWVSGVALGDFTSPHCGLSGFHQNVLALSDALPRLGCQQIDAEPPDVAFKFLNKMVYGLDERSDAEISFDAAIWTRHCFLTNVSEAFDRLNGFVHFVAPDAVRILVREEPPDRLHFATLPLDQFRAIARDFDAWATPRSAV